MDDEQKIIIRIPNWLGDAVMASPAVWDWAAQHPETEFTLLGLPLTLSVYQHSPYPIRCVAYDRAGMHQGLWGMMSIAARLRKERYDVGYLLTHSVSSALIFKYGNVSKRIGYRKGLNAFFLTHTKPRCNAPTHQAQRYYQLLHDAVPESLQPKIFLSEAEINKATRFLESLDMPKTTPLIGMAVGASYGNAKRWLPDRYAQIGKWCVNELGARVLLFGSAGELDTIHPVHAAIGKGSTVQAGKTSLRDSFALAAQCRMMLCNDSGMMHAAAAVGTPVIAMIGPTDPTDTAPLGEGHKLLNKRVACAPCLKRECPLKHHECMKAIRVDDVQEAILQRLQREALLSPK